LPITGGECMTRGGRAGVKGIISRGDAGMTSDWSKATDQKLSILYDRIEDIRVAIGNLAEGEARNLQKVMNQIVEGNKQVAALANALADLKEKLLVR
jgi:hypothetical protein